ncbi:cryptochrome/photolyase family protein [Granulosicoccus antarcticus]|uniref:(6-4) photolyase n=1 Tax=Granulosicoccus antarcticus IMCC3135 TaxID=1192854 RepID=A0A2Z2NXE5_9GAMM|nr:cryptochrome/photolyase family protein [Granulosicoccus antarcticus]ASJ76122.1 (6-4) photolyase [Granulosicoccus antarcticus IMCC3135]
MQTAALIFPHQLFDQHPAIRDDLEKVYLVEESLFFGDDRYPLTFHRQKLAYHLATLDAYEKRLKQQHPVERIAYTGKSSLLDTLMVRLAENGCDCLRVVDVHDFELNKRLHRSCAKSQIELVILPTPAFLNTPEENQDFRSGRKRWFMADFYQWQRRRFDVLMEDGKPAGGQWSFDEDNRKKMPTAEIKLIQPLPVKQRTARIRRACDQADKLIPDARGHLHDWLYPTTHEEAADWLDRFCAERFAKFGPFEDAMVHGQSFLHHSVLTPMLNTGLLTPQQVLDTALAAQKEYKIPLNSVEGFIRQLIGWREFMRATYDDLGVRMRTTNHWQHHNPLPDGFYTAETGIAPIDDCIGRVLETGYCHHIERLMLLGGFLFLCEVDPDEIYRWFMEMFIDAYDWVMVPNVYAMSQNADGGLITTKPYFSGSNYVLKMSNYQRGDWCDIWDGLYWRWIWKQRKALSGNPRWAMMCRAAEKMDAEKRQNHLNCAEAYLESM